MHDLKEIARHRADADCGRLADADGGRLPAEAPAVYSVRTVVSSLCLFYFFSNVWLISGTLTAPFSAVSKPSFASK